jgi:hypothetical protein
MAKCKLGLANNSNKLSTLENLLDFTNLIKWYKYFHLQFVVFEYIYFIIYCVNLKSYYWYFLKFLGTGLI